MIRIEPAIHRRMLDDARQVFPDECCGFLFGTEEGDQRLITDILVVDNSRQGDKRRRFEISARDYLRAEQYALDRGLTLLSVYHSHPSCPAIPSETDRLAAQPFFSYVIVSFYEDGPREVLSWRLNEERQFDAEPILDHSHV